MIRITAFAWVPPMAQGLVRDLRVRWALEEAGLAYETRFVGPDEQRSADYRALQPFGQVPAYEEDGLALFESGAIVMHVAARCDALLPADDAGRARAASWGYAALNSVEPPIAALAQIDLFYPDQPWAKERRPGVVKSVERRLDDLARWLEGREYLEERFTAADLLMTTVLRILRHTDLVARRPLVAAYQQRCEDRPAFVRALADQMVPFAQNAPPPG